MPPRLNPQPLPLPVESTPPELRHVPDLACVCSLSFIRCIWSVPSPSRLCSFWTASQLENPRQEAEDGAWHPLRSREQCPGRMPGDLHALLAPVGWRTNRLRCFQTWVIIWGAVLAREQYIMNAHLHPKQSEILRVHSYIQLFEWNPGMFCPPV